MKYAKKISVEALQLNADNSANGQFDGFPVRKLKSGLFVSYPVANGTSVDVHESDWIVKHENGLVKCLTDSEFAAAGYKPVKETPAKEKEQDQ